MPKIDKQKLTWGALAFVGLLCLYLIVVLSFWVTSQNKVYPDATLNGENIAGANEAQIETTVKDQYQKYQNTKINFTPAVTGPATVSELGLTPDYEKTVQSIISWGGGDPFVLGAHRDFPIIFKSADSKLAEKIAGISDQMSTPAEDPTLRLENGEIKFKNGQAGQRINVAQTAANVLAAAGKLKTSAQIAEFSIEPSFSETDASAQMAEIKKATANSVTFTAAGQNFPVDQATQVSWIQLSGSLPVLAHNFGDDPLLSALSATGSDNSIFSGQAVSNFLTQLSAQINKSPVNAQLAEVNGALTITSPSQTGQNLDVTASVSAVLEGLAASRATIPLTVQSQKPEVREDNLAELGITGLLSTGYTNFASSPANRLVNIRVGSSRFNGALIRPNEVFSFNDTLGPVDAAHGYLPELVILEDKTTPEYGGGMCQVSSTAFRAALNAGLPILARTAHAYPVSYYKPYGVDATVYLPQPDLIFQNDTGHYILIQTYISGTRLTFEFYGTKPNRTIAFAGNADANGAVPIAEQITPAISESGARGTGSFTAQFWRFIYDSAGKLISKSSWVSKYDSPSKYPH